MAHTEQARTTSLPCRLPIESSQSSSLSLSAPSPRNAVRQEKKGPCLEKSDELVAEVVLVHEAFHELPQQGLQRVQYLSSPVHPSSHRDVLILPRAALHNEGATQTPRPPIALRPSWALHTRLTRAYRQETDRTSSRWRVLAPPPQRCRCGLAPRALLDG